MKYQIVSRSATDGLSAIEWANAACRIGWRVVCCFPELGGFTVWAEAPEGADPDAWDRERYT